LHSSIKYERNGFQFGYILRAAISGSIAYLVGLEWVHAGDSLKEMLEHVARQIKPLFAGSNLGTSSATIHQSTFPKHGIPPKPTGYLPCDFLTPESGELIASRIMRDWIMTLSNT
jgi:hypothetical protein